MAPSQRNIVPECKPLDGHSLPAPQSEEDNNACFNPKSYNGAQSCSKLQDCDTNMSKRAYTFPCPQPQSHNMPQNSGLLSPLQWAVWWLPASCVPRKVQRLWEQALATILSGPGSSLPRPRGEAGLFTFGFPITAVSNSCLPGEDRGRQQLTAHPGAAHL